MHYWIHLSLSRTIEARKPCSSIVSPYRCSSWSVIAAGNGARMAGMRAAAIVRAKTDYAGHRILTPTDAPAGRRDQHSGVEVLYLQ